MGFPGGSAVKNPLANAGDTEDAVQSLGEGNGNPLQYSCLGNLMDIGAWQATIPVVVRTGQDLATKLYMTSQYYFFV